MPNQCVVIADGARARFFALESRGLPEIEGGPALYEAADLENPAKAGSSRDSAPPSDSRGHRGSPSSGSSDHRGRHQAQMDRRFAKQVAQRAAELAYGRGAHTCIIVADPKTLGMLRPELRALGNQQVSFTELSKDLCRLSVHEIQSHLARLGQLPARRAPRSVRPAA
ncbi:MAG: host attachment protein [Polyangiaceae bacterium]|nr:host attachment protein [Polyangiaceae bacterium]